MFRENDHLLHYHDCALDEIDGQQRDDDCSTSSILLEPLRNNELLCRIEDENDDEHIEEIEGFMELIEDLAQHSSASLSLAESPSDQRMDDEIVVERTLTEKSTHSESKIVPPQDNGPSVGAQRRKENQTRTLKSAYSHEKSGSARTTPHPETIGKITSNVAATSGTKKASEVMTEAKMTRVKPKHPVSAYNIF